MPTVEGSPITAITIACGSITMKKLFPILLIALGAVGLSHTYQFQDWPGSLSAGQVALLVLYAAFMLGVCLLACVIPTWRVLRVQPMEALRAE